MENKSLYQYIIENIDPEDQNFTQSTLPDEPFPTVPHPLGAEEAYWFASNTPPYARGAEEVYKCLQSFLQQPDQVRKQKLYQSLIGQPIVAIAEPLADRIANEELTEMHYNLARSFFYNAKHRSAVKFAYLLFGLYGMQRIENEDAQLWEDLIKVAQCEEFTYSFIFACDLGNFVPNRAYWRLIGCTEGWGKAFAVDKVSCGDEAQALWLVQHGMELSVDYPPLCKHIIEATGLPTLLRKQNLDQRTWKGAMELLNAFLVVLNNLGDSMLEEYVNTAKINILEMLANVLHHAKVHADIPERILQVLNLRIGLENLLDNNEFALVDYNEGQMILAECDSIVYAKNWSQYVAENIIKQDELNYELCDFACELDMDIWQPVFDYYCAHPYEYKAMPYIFSYYDEEYQFKMLQVVEKNLDLYRTEEGALLVPLRFLAHTPGLGEKIIIAALEGLYDWPRGIACSVINDWGIEYLSEPLRQSLLVARELSNNAVVTARIDALLAGREYTMEDMLQGANV